MGFKHDGAPPHGGRQVSALIIISQLLDWSFSSTSLACEVIRSLAPWLPLVVAHEGNCLPAKITYQWDAMLHRIMKYAECKGEITKLSERQHILFFLDTSKLRTEKSGGEGIFNGMNCNISDNWRSCGRNTNQNLNFFIRLVKRLHKQTSLIG